MSDLLRRRLMSSVDSDAFIEDSVNASDYLTITAVASSTISFSRDIEFSPDVYNWQTLSAGNQLSLSIGQKLLFKANYKDATSTRGIGKFSITGRCMLSGNCMSLIFGGKAYAKDSLAGINYAFAYLFEGCTGVYSILSGFLPAKTLSQHSYNNMFRNCTSLTLIATDLLPATNLSNYCYSAMFYGCSSLTSGPKLPATKMVMGCYESMFSRCTSLTTAPELPATELAYSCYNSMFYENKKLEKAPELPATELATYCYRYMFRACSLLNYIKMLAIDVDEGLSMLTYWTEGVASTGTFVKNANANWNIVGISGIPEGWNVEYDIQNDKYCVFIPTSPFSFGFYSGPTVYYSTDNGVTWTGLKSDTKSPTFDVGTVILVKSSIHCGGYNTTGTGSFRMTGTVKLAGNCMSLKYGDNALDYDTAPNSVFKQLFMGCSAIQSVSKDFLPAKIIEADAYRNMFADCTSLTNMPDLPSTSIASGCYAGMFRGCSSLTETTEALPSTTLYDECYSQMFRYCSAITRAPVLPALTLVTSCYSSMFNDCRKLSYIKAMFLTTPSSTYCHMWAYGTASTGTFVKNAAATWDGNISFHGIPSGWTVETATT